MTNSICCEPNHISFLHKLVFGCASEMTAVCALFTNSVSLYCFHRDGKFTNSFHIFVGNIAMCDIIYALAMATLNLLVIFCSSLGLCIAYRTITFLVKQEVSLLLFLLTHDRILLITNVMYYRPHFGFARRQAIGLVVLSWSVCLVFGVFYQFTRFSGYESKEKEQEDIARCHIYPTPFLDFGVTLQMGVDVVLLATYVYLIHLSKEIQKRISTFLSLSKSSTKQLLGWDEATTSFRPISPGSGKSDSTGIKAVTDQSQELKLLTDTTEKMDHKQGGNDVISDSMLALSSGLALNAAGQHDVRMGTTDGEMWSQHPAIKSTLHHLMAKRTGCSQQGVIWQLDVLATQQLGSFLLLHLLSGTPVYLCRLLASVCSQQFAAKASRFVHWLDWLVLLRTCLFPFLHYIYSNSLRHFYRHISWCPCLLQQPRVSPAAKQ